MPPADNTHHLRAATRRRAENARTRAAAALLAMRSAGEPVMPTGLARAAGVARSWVYSQPELLAAIRSAAVPPPSPAGVRATDESWQRRLALAHDRIRELAEENTRLRRQLAVAHGQLRSARTVGAGA